MGNENRQQREKAKTLTPQPTELLPTKLLYNAVVAEELEMAGASWVEGERFFGREVDLALLTERVHRGSHTLLTAARRMGKTSLVRELLRRLRESDDFETFYVDLEAAEDHRHAVAEIGSRCAGTGSVRSRVTRILGETLGRVEKLSVFDLTVQLRARIDDGNWQYQADELLEGIASCDRPAVLAIDELPILVNRLLRGHDYSITPERRARTDQFLGWLRKNAQAHQGRMSLILTGSVGLEPILSQANLSALANAYEPYNLQPWTVEEASECLAALARHYDLRLESSLRQRICHRLRCCIPHHVQQFFSHLHHHLRLARRSEATVHDVEVVYSERMLSVDGQVHLEHYEGRLREMLGSAGYRLALELLTEAACGREPLTAQALALYRSHAEDSLEGSGATVSDVLRVLEHDGYLEKVDGGYCFVSGLLEDWWRARHCSHYVPLGDREGPDV